MKVKEDSSAQYCCQIVIMIIKEITSFPKIPRGYLGDAQDRGLAGRRVGGEKEERGVRGEIRKRKDESDKLESERERETAT